MLPSKENIALSNKIIAKFMGAKKSNGVTLIKTKSGKGYKENRTYVFPYSEHGFSKAANNYIEADFEKSLRGEGSQIEYLAKNILADSGADDYGCYITKEDEAEFS